MFKVFGKLPVGSRLEKIKKSHNYKHGAFQNVNQTSVMSENTSIFKMLRDFYNKPSTTEPSSALPTVKSDLKKPVAQTTFNWFGHSSYFIRTPEFNILVDPVMSGNASPVSLFAKSFPGTDIYTVDDFPQIDILLITHDHYDHLDYKTILKLKNKTKRIITSLGVGQHLEYWGIRSEMITELNWWESCALPGNSTLTATPSRHFSGRSIKRAQSVWSSFVLKMKEKTIFLGGDSGYDDQFKLIGEKFGPFNLVLLDCAQYNVDWPQIHMVPEQTVQAALDLKTELLIPVHWGKFSLAYHPWNDPPERIIKAAAGTSLNIYIPVIGETFTLDNLPEQKYWWRDRS